MNTEWVDFHKSEFAFENEWQKRSEKNKDSGKQ
jgi:hypothetical protein